MITRLARFANDCYHVFRAPTGPRASILRDLINLQWQQNGVSDSMFRSVHVEPSISIRPAAVLLSRGECHTAGFGLQGKSWHGISVLQVVIPELSG
jgi:hypothetical protein